MDLLSGAIWLKAFGKLLSSSVTLFNVNQTPDREIQTQDPRAGSDCLLSRWRPRSKYHIAIAPNMDSTLIVMLCDMLAG